MSDQSVTIKLTINQFNAVMAGVVKLPIEVGMEVFNELQKQASAQLGDPTSNTLPGSALPGGKLN